MVKNQLNGKVISNKMKKTVVVEVKRIKKDRKYKRRYNYLKSFKAHDEKEECKIGDEVLIEECRPMSKDKKWRVIKRTRLSTIFEPEKELEEPMIEEVLEKKKTISKPDEENLNK